MGVDTRSPQSVEIGDFDVSDVLLREYAPRGAFPHHLGHAHAWVVGKVRSEALSVRALIEVVDFFEAGCGEFLHEAWHVGAPVDETNPTEPTGHSAECAQVDVDNCVDTGALNLDDHVCESGEFLVSGRKDCPVNLAQRGSSERLWVDPTECHVEWHAKLALGQCPNRVEGNRGHLVLQADEFVGDDWRKDIQSGRHELSELDHEPTQVKR